MDFSKFQEIFEPHLRRFLVNKQEHLKKYTHDAVLTEILVEPMRLIQAGGKRLRPMLGWLGYRLAGGTEEDAVLDAVVALELYHTFALVHDDIMDRGTERHGVPTVHVSIEHQLKGRTGDLAHVGVSQAIIIGDLLFSWAVEALTRASFAPEYIQTALRVFFSMSDEVMVGQMLDIDVTTRERSSLVELEQKMLLKTAGYTFTRPLELGIALAGWSEPSAVFAEAFGAALGVAFQLQDDLLDVFGSVERTGKTPLSDMRDRQQTVLTQVLLERGSAQDREAYLSVRGQTVLDEAMVQRVRQAFVRSGAFAYAIDSCRAARARAEQALEQSSASEEDRKLLRLVIDKAVPLAVIEDLEREALGYASSS